MEEKLNELGERINDRIKKEHSNSAHIYEFQECPNSYVLYFMRKDKKNNVDIYKTMLAASFSKIDYSCTLFIGLLIEHTDRESTTLYPIEEEEFLKANVKVWIHIYHILLRNVTKFLEKEKSLRLQKLTNHDFFKDKIQDLLQNQKEEIGDTIENNKTS